MLLTKRYERRMDRIILERFETSDQGTFGRIQIGNETFYTGELPWRDNASNISCIPSGLYECRFTMSARFKRRMYLVSGVNNRSGIRIHSANLMGAKDLGYRCQLNGCISLGERLGVIEGQKAILVSSPAVRRFESLMNGQNFILEIINGF